MPHARPGRGRSLIEPHKAALARLGRGYVPFRAISCKRNFICCFWGGDGLIVQILRAGSTSDSCFSSENPPTDLSEKSSAKLLGFAHVRLSDSLHIHELKLSQTRAALQHAS